jgi:hypothetical protein
VLQTVTVLLLLALVPSLLGCYGEFPLTHMVYRFNGDITNSKVVHTVLFWIFVILPVYDIAVIGDAVIFNLIEFWTGKELDEARIEQADGSELSLTPSAGGGEAVLSLTRDGHAEPRAVFRRISDTECEVRPPDGTLAGKVLQRPDGSLVLTDARGHTVRTVAVHDPLAAATKRR